VKTDYQVVDVDVFSPLQHCTLHVPEN